MHIPIIGDAFGEIVALLFLAVVVGALVLRLRQPILVGFILVGVIVGPSGLGLVRAADHIALLAELGLAILLFIVGLKLDVGSIRSLGPAALATGGGQVVATAGLGYVLALALGMSKIGALYVAMAVTFSSTIIVIKLLSDKRETDSLHGRLAVGVLIVQDLVVVFLMIALSTLSNDGRGGTGKNVIFVVVSGAVILVVLGLLSAYVLPRLLQLFARSKELLILFAIAWAVGLADLTKVLGFSMEVGAFLAGAALASTQFREPIAARLVSLRDFLLVFFFVELGSRLDISSLGASALLAIPLALFVLIGKPLLVMAILGLQGYRKRTSFLTGVSLGQISEFSLILMALGIKLGHIDLKVSGVVTLAALITISISGYAISFSGYLYERLSGYLQIFERKTPRRLDASVSDHDIDIILYGLGRYGGNIAKHLYAQDRNVLGVDFNPRAIEKCNNRGWNARFGDAEDPEFPHMLPLESARWVISSIRELPVNLTLINSLTSHGFQGGIAVTAQDQADASKLKDAGATVVFVPFSDSAQQAVEILNIADQKEARRKMDKLISNLNNHYIVCGYGRMGQQIVRDFQRYGVPFVVIEWNPEQLPKLIEGNIPHIEGKASEDKILLDAGIERAKGLIAVTATDEENVFIVLSARGLNPQMHIVARSILSENEDKLRRAGANRVISPYILGGHQMTFAVLKPQVTDFLEQVMHSEKFDIELGEMHVTKSSPFAGKSIRDSNLSESTGVVVLAVRKSDGSYHTTPTPDFMIDVDDHLIIIGSASEIEEAKRQGERH